MKSLVDKLSAIAPELEQRGNVFLLALFERDDVPGKWDVVFSSDWSDRDPTAATRIISDKIIPNLNAEELSALSRIAIIPSTQPAVIRLSSAINVSAGCSEISESNSMGVQIKHAFVLRCKRPPTVASPAPSVTT
jgi:hypothetical protein